VRPSIDDASIEVVAPSELRARLEALKNEGFNMLLDLGAVDYLGRTPRFEVVYHLLKMPTAPANVAQVGTPVRLRVRCLLNEGEHVPSAMGIWPAADWAEREVFDLFGIIFDGHTDLRRIQMPHDWEGYPLRKDYPLRGPARERSPRPAFALKSNVQAGTPPSGKTLEALQEQIIKAKASDPKGRGLTGGESE
jgi:NADH-quinone oxidoreductase subunit C